MAKGVTRVNGKGGETMEVSNGVVSFRSGGATHKMDVEKAEVMEVMNAEDARAFVEESPKDTFGLWVYNKMPSSKGKNVYMVASDTSERWVMEISKNQAPNAVRFARAIVPKSKEEEEEEIKLYAAIQTPLGAVFTVGSIACVLGAYAALSVFEQPIVALVLAAAAIYMFIKIK